MSDQYDDIIACVIEKDLSRAAVIIRGSGLQAECASRSKSDCVGFINVSTVSEHSVTYLDTVYGDVVSVLHDRLTAIAKNMFDSGDTEWAGWVFDGIKLLMEAYARIEGQ